MRILCARVALVFLFLTSLVQAEDGLTPAAQVFQENYSNSTVYHVADCSSNVWRLLGTMQERHVDLSQVNVIYIYRTKHGASDPGSNNIRRLRPFRARLGIGPIAIPWIFHVVLESQGLILDFDYRHSATPVPLVRYFTRMFGDVQDKAFFVRIIPAAEYLRDYNPQGDRNWRYYLHDEGRAYPALALSGIL